MNYQQYRYSYNFFADFLELGLILIGVLKAELTAWSTLTVVKNHIIVKAMVTSVVNHIGFSHAFNEMNFNSSSLYFCLENAEMV